MSGSSRLFFAVWPDDTLAKRLARIAGWCCHHSGARQVPIRNLHLTLLFLGQVGDDQRAALAEVAAALETPPVTLTFDRIEYWPKAKILCLATAAVATTHPLTQFVERLRAAARTNGLKVDQRPYQPHVTLARKVRLLTEPPVVEPFQWRLDRHCLVKSVPERGRYRYQVLAQW